MRQMNCTPFILSCLALASLLPYAEAANAGNSAQEQELMVTEPRPFVCDVKTGYLLQCSFVSPRPYCWRNASVDALNYLAAIGLRAGIRHPVVADNTR